MSNAVDKFIENSKNWKAEIAKLRSIVLQTKLDENLKWRLPCYSYNESNIVIIQPFKANVALMFFKGTLMKDPKKILVDVGPNSQAARRIEFTSASEITKHAAAIKSYIKEAIALEDAGEKVEFKKKPESIPAELKDVFTKQPNLKKAFSALTPGRQRAYLLFFNGAKQSQTKLTRIKKFTPHILKGKGMNDR